MLARPRDPQRLMKSELAYLLRCRECAMTTGIYECYDQHDELMSQGVVITNAPQSLTLCNTIPTLQFISSDIELLVTWDELLTHCHQLSSIVEIEYNVPPAI